MNKVIETSWNTYRELVLPKSTPAVQIIECRRAFYAGAASLFGSVMLNLTPGDEIANSDIELLETLQQEIEDFGRELDMYVLGSTGKPS